MVEARTQRRWRPRDAAGPGEEVSGGTGGAGGGWEAVRARAPESLEALAAGLGVHPLVARLLRARGVGGVDAARRFLDPRLTDLSDPEAIPGVSRAAERIAAAIRDRQPIVIYGDYDVDGITASAIVWHVLRQLGGDVSTYVPHRLDEGYGLNEAAIRELAPAGPLIISVDCGITATGPAKIARDLGLDLVITDHHHFDPADLPDAYVLVHPGLEQRGAKSEERTEADRSSLLASRSSLSDLCGAGVAFKLAWQVARVYCGTDKLPKALRELLMDLLSLVALGTVADVVPLVGENRVLTRFGLARIKDTRFAGLNALIDAARLRDEKVDAYHVGFSLGPRLNACGRMGHADKAVHLLTAADAAESRETAAFLTRENDRRRATERGIFDEAHQMVLDAGYHHEDRRAIVLGKEGWHAGVIGIVASRLVERFSRPVVMLTLCPDDGTAHGSARSVDGVSIHDGLAACSHHLERFGGHAMAAGLALRLDTLDAFRDDLIAYVNGKLGPDDLLGVVEYDAPIDLAACRVELFDQVHALEPFGRGNPAPRLLLSRAVLDRPAQRIGGAGRHLSLLLRQGDRIMRAVAFNQGDRAEELPGGAVIDAIFEPKASIWQGVRRAELHVKDFRLTAPQARG